MDEKDVPVPVAVPVKPTLFLPVAIVVAVFLALLLAAILGELVMWKNVAEQNAAKAAAFAVPKHVALPTVDPRAFDAKLLALAHSAEGGTAPANLPAEGTVKPPTPPAPDKTAARAPLWPVKTAYPEVGAILPFSRIVAYYGNFYAKGMGVLGEYPENVMIGMFEAEIKKWQDADPTTPVLPAVDYIAISAQDSPGADRTYRSRMPPDQIDKAIALADKLNGIVILEVQAGDSDVMTEVKSLATYLANPKVHLAIDPEFAMHGGARPGSVVGSVDASQVNQAAQFLAGIVRSHKLPPKVLIVHRYTQKMVTNATKITPLPQVEIVMDMDGWGPKERKISTYQSYIYSEPVQFTGFKLFYKNDVKRAGSVMMTPAEVLKLTPQPLFIQYQ